MLRLSLSLAAVLAFCVTSLRAENLSPLATSPRWNSLEQYQETISREDFARLLDTVYATRGYGNLISIGSDSARVVEDRAANKFFELRFCTDGPRKLPRQYWRLIDKLPRRKKPLAHLNIALDPGHLGGHWARMEERWFQVDDKPPVQEGELTWRVAKILAPKLRALGAEVSFARRHAKPMTPLRPDDFREVARTVLAKSGVNDPVENYENTNDENKEKSVRWQSELLFYRQSEIRYRAKRVNEFLQPDLVLCLHFNAEAWGDPKNPTLTDRDHFHVLINGSYLADELEHDDVRYEMIRRLLSRVYDEELPLADSMAATLARETKLPPYQYTTDTVTKVGTSSYVYARNLLATRLYRCPVVYFEPYVMNSNDAFARIEAGDYAGTRDINGAQRPSIFCEYAQAIADGLADYCSGARDAAAPVCSGGL